MIILDTNVVSEIWRPIPEPNVLTWMDAQPSAALYLTAVTVAELGAGLAAMPKGRRRDGLLDRFEQGLLPLFQGRVLPFDIDAARAYAALTAAARSAGRPIGVADAEIAAIAAVRGFTVATRDGAPFRTAGVPVVDPWRRDPRGREGRP